VKKVSRTW